MEAMAQDFKTAESACPRLTAIETTLYELIEAVEEEVQPEEDGLIAETVLRLLDTGQVKFLGDAPNREDNSFEMLSTKKEQQRVCSAFLPSGKQHSVSLNEDRISMIHNS